MSSALVAGPAAVGDLCPMAVDRTKASERRTRQKGEQAQVSDRAADLNGRRNTIVDEVQDSSKDFDELGSVCCKVCATTRSTPMAVPFKSPFTSLPLWATIPAEAML